MKSNLIQFNQLKFILEGDNWQVMEVKWVQCMGDITRFADAIMPSQVCRKRCNLSGSSLVWRFSVWSVA
jgi:hypothetical protein